LRRASQRYRAAKQLRDYTSLLEAEKAQKTQELLDTCNLQKNLIESSVAGILACDANDTVVTFNRSMEEMLGFSKEQVVDQKKLRTLFPAGEQLRFKTAFEAGEHGGRGRLYLYETRLLHADGDEIPVQVSATAILEEGRENGLVCCFRDLRKIRHLERQMADQARILHQDKMMSLGRLAASMVHEINNPLAGILNYLRLMGRILKRGPLAENDQRKFTRYLDLVETETVRCSQIVSNLLTFSRKSESVFSSVDVRNLIDRCVLLSRHKLELSSIEIRVRIPDGLPGIHGDFNHLQQ
jgi:PAS domain S-box-containing protein